MPKLWLTYAWKDNEANDVDYVIAELKAAGIEVAFDRAHLLAGRRLWDQISTGIEDPSLDGWAIYATKASLESEPCQEELAYALDRVLRTRGSQFNLIGIFPEPMDRSVVPSALATRLYVNLAAADWRQQIVDGLMGSKSPPSLSPGSPYGFQWHLDGTPALEVWPRTGQWVPTFMLVPKKEEGLVKMIMAGPRGHVTGTGMSMYAPAQTNDGSYVGLRLDQPVTAQTTAHLLLNGIPSAVMFGTAQERYILKQSANLI